MSWPPKKDFEYVYKRPARVYKRPARQVFVPQIESTLTGTKMAWYDTELYESMTNGISLVFFQRQLGQAFASSNAGFYAKTDKHTNVLQPSQLHQPLQFSLFGIAADYPFEDFVVSKLITDKVKDPTVSLDALRDARLSFAHAQNRNCFECKLGDLPTLGALERQEIPEKFMKSAHEFLEYGYDRICGVSDKPFPEWADTWKPCEEYRHVQAGDAFQVKITWEKKLPIICPIKISLYGVSWFPR